MWAAVCKVALPLLTCARSYKNSYCTPHWIYSCHPTFLHHLRNRHVAFVFSFSPFYFVGIFAICINWIWLLCLSKPTLLTKFVSLFSVPSQKPPSPSSFQFCQLLPCWSCHAVQTSKFIWIFPHTESKKRKWIYYQKDNCKIKSTFLSITKKIKK